MWWIISGQVFLKGYKSEMFKNRKAIKKMMAFSIDCSSENFIGLDPILISVLLLQLYQQR